MVTSRERVQTTLNHQQPDRVPLDLGAAPTTGMHASSVYLLRQALRLDPPGTPVKIIEPYQLLGEIKPDLQAALGVDVVGVWPIEGLFGFKNEGWKPWSLPDGTPVLVPDAFNTDPEPDGSYLMYPAGDRTAPPSGHLPKGGFYFDTIVRQPPFDEDHLDPFENVEEFSPISEEALAHFAREVDLAYTQTDKAVLVNFGGTAFGDIAIRDVQEWYVSLAARKEYIARVFELQCEIALENLNKLYNVLGNRVDVVYMTGTDFGTQRAPFISVAAYRELFRPYHKALNDWIHANTTWKTFMHSDGALMPLIPEFIDAGFDVLNPVQWTAEGMDPQTLKDRFGERLVFWGAGVNTQGSLPHGTPAEVRAEVQHNIRIFGKGGGYVFNTIHNVQPLIPVDNLVALYEAVRDYRTYG
ncbi:MAG: methyltransferase [Anaerolineales bacterium]|nr:methyltransferase [Anaerolineales bacterium]